MKKNDSLEHTFNQLKGFVEMMEKEVKKEQRELKKYQDLSRNEIIKMDRNEKKKKNKSTKSKKNNNKEKKRIINTAAMPTKPFKKSKMRSNGDGKNNRPPKIVLDMPKADPELLKRRIEKFQKKD